MCGKAVKGRCRNVSRRVTVCAASGMSTMKIRVQGRHMETTPAIKEFIEEKVSKVSG